jgi:hypothetical protein
MCNAHAVPYCALHAWGWPPGCYSVHASTRQIADCTCRSCCRCLSWRAGSSGRRAARAALQPRRRSPAAAQWAAAPLAATPH